MLYKGVSVEEINLVVYLKEQASKSWKDNEKEVLKWLNTNNITAGVENPIDDMVYLYFLDAKELDIKLLSEVYRKAEKDFEEVKVNLYLDGCIEGEGNSVDLSLDELLSHLNN